jgi:hypothetical protein
MIALAILTVLLVLVILGFLMTQPEKATDDGPTFADLGKASVELRTIRRRIDVGRTRFEIQQDIRTAEREMREAFDDLD